MSQRTYVPADQESLSHRAVGFYERMDTLKIVRNTLAALMTMSMPLLACPSYAQAKERPVTPKPSGFVSVKTINGKKTLVDDHGKPFYSLGMNHVTMEGYLGRDGKNIYHDTAVSKYRTEAAWAAAQQVRFREWGINTIAAFSTLKPFEGSDIYMTAFIDTGVHSATTDLWSKSWTDQATSRITQAARMYRNNTKLIGYFIDNEIFWTFDLFSLGQPDKELFQMGRYFRYPSSTTVLIPFLRERYSSPGELKTDFPTAILNGTNWENLDLSTATLGTETTDRGKATMNAWAAIMAQRYFSVTSAALKAADKNHLNLGHKFVAALAPISVLKVAAPYVDVLSLDFYDTSIVPTSTSPASMKNVAAPQGVPIGSDLQSMVAGLIDFSSVYSTKDMLAEFYKATGKPILIAEFAYRGADTKLKNAIPPGVALRATQKLRGEAIANYANCAINAPYIVGIHYFELFDEPVSGRFDGEDSNWGAVSEDDVPYPYVVQALRGASELAKTRLSTRYEAAPCAPVGVQHQMQ